MAIDINQLIADIQAAATGVLKKDITTLGGFSDQQLLALAQQAVLVEAGIVSGQITAATREFFLDGLQEMARNFVATLRGLVEITIEKVWNAVVDVLWKAIRAGTGLALPGPG